VRKKMRMISLGIPKMERFVFHQDDTTVWKLFPPGTTANILGEKVCGVLDEMQ
jgi:hypothetical protein